MNEKDVVEIQRLYNKITSELILSGINPLMIAGILCASGVRMYKNNMPLNEFRKMMNIVHKEAVK